MKIVGCDLHARQQTIAMVDTETGEFTEKTLSHEGNAVRAVLRSPGRSGGGGHRSHGIHAVVLGTAGRVGHRMPSGAPGQDPSERDAQAEARSAGCTVDIGTANEDRFPEIWMPSTEERDLRTLLRDRHQWVKMRARLQHTLQAIALNHALRQGHALWSQAGQNALQALPLPPYTSQRRTELLSLYVQLQKRIQELDKEVEAQARQRPQARRLLTHPGVGPVTALATDVFLGDPSRFATANQVASYIGMIPCEHTSGKRQRLGKMSKQGNSLLRYLWTEAAMSCGTERPGAATFLSAQAHPERNGQGQDRSGTQTGYPAVDHDARRD